MGETNIFKVLADSQRRDILTMLKNGRLNAGEIAEELQITPAALSYHLKLLKSADLVSEYKEKNYHVERLTNELRMLGLSVECFDFDNQLPTELMQYDVVELIGGNPYYLLNSIQKNCFFEVHDAG